MSSTVRLHSNIFHYFFISELLRDLENCENDPVAIAECFVSKVSQGHFSGPIKTNTKCKLFSFSN